MHPYAHVSGLLFINGLQFPYDSLHYFFLTLAQWVVYANYM